MMISTVVLIILAMTAQVNAESSKNARGILERKTDRGRKTVGDYFKKSDRKNVIMGRKVSARSTDPFAWHLLGMISYL